MLNARSVNSIVIAPASTGKERRRRTAVTSVAHVNNGIVCKDIPGARILSVVTMKLMAPKVLLIPAKCRAKMARSTDAPLCEFSPESGGYKVHPVPGPCSTIEEISKRAREGGSNQSEMLFRRGKAISTAPICTGSI